MKSASIILSSCFYRDTYVSVWIETNYNMQQAHYTTYTQTCVVTISNYGEHYSCGWYITKEWCFWRCLVFSASVDRSERWIILVSIIRYCFGHQDISWTAWGWLSMFLPSLRLALLLLYRSHASNQHALPSYTTVYIIQHSLKSVICLTNAVEALHTDTFLYAHDKNKSSIHIA